MNGSKAKKAARDTTSLLQFFGPCPSKKITGRDTAQPAEEAAADEEECRMIQSVRILFALSVTQSVEWMLIALAVQC